MDFYSSVVIYYFSGTGNALNMARWFRDVAQREGTGCTLIDIAGEPSALVSPPTGALVVIISPVHGFNYPPLVLGFLRRFPRGNNRVLLMNTRAGMLVGLWVTPGLTGVAFMLASLMLMVKGYRISGMRPFDMPSNWISVHPGLNRRTVEFLHVKNKERVDGLATKVLTGKSDFWALREIVQDVLMAPVALGYYLAGRFIFAKTYFASSACDGCGLCMDKCPAGAIKLVDGRPFWTFWCESCMRCMSYCPKKAIETAHGFVTVVVVLYSGLMLGLMHRFLGPWVPFENAVVGFVTEWLLFVVMMGAGYRMMHYALRFKVFERLLLMTSLTWYRFWGRRYRALKSF